MKTVLNATLIGLLFAPHGIAQAQRFGFTIGMSASQSSDATGSGSTAYNLRSPSLPPLPSLLPFASAVTLASLPFSLKHLDLLSMHLVPPMLNFPVEMRRPLFPQLPLPLDPIAAVRGPQTCQDTGALANLGGILASAGTSRIVQQTSERQK